MAAGMLSGLFSPKFGDLRQDNQDQENHLMSLARMDPFQQAGYAALAGSRIAGQGLGEAVATVAGADPRSPLKKNADAVEAAKAQVAQLGFNADDPKSIDDFYKRVIQILQQQGLAAEALDVAREWHKQKNEDLQTAAKTDEVARKRQRDLASDATAQARNRILEKKGALGSETIQLLNQIDGLDPLDPQQKVKIDAITARLNALSASKGVKFVNLGDRVSIVDAVTGKELRSEDVGEKPMSAKDAAKTDATDTKLSSAYAEAKAGYQKQYDAAAALYNSAGLDAITGRLGRLIGTEGAAGQTATTIASGPARAALALWKQVTGATFLAGLATLKAASATGSTGLGAVSNVEGEKVQAAAAALSREQDGADLRKQLGIYIQTLVDSAGRLDTAAQQSAITPVSLRTSALTGPKGSRPAAAPFQAPVAPTAPVAPPAAPSGGVVEWEMGPDGKPRRKGQ